MQRVAYHYHNQDTEQQGPSSPKSPPNLLQSIPSSNLYPWAAIDHFVFIKVFLYQNLYIELTYTDLWKQDHGDIQSSNTDLILLQCVHVEACVSLSFLPLLRNNSIALIDHNVFIHSALEGHLGSFQFGVVINNSGMTELHIQFMFNFIILLFISFLSFRTMHMDLQRLLLAQCLGWVPLASVW